MSTGVLPGSCISDFHRSLDWPRTALRNSCQGAGLTYTQLLA